MHAGLRNRLLLLPVVVLVAGCDVHVGNLSARATDEWTHTYPLKPGGEIQIDNTKGKIEVEGTDAATVEIRAERVAKGATDAAARELLPRIVIKEDATPDRVAVRTERMGGIMIGASFEVRYHVRAPKNAVVNVSNTNGQVTLTGLNGKVTAHTTNGQVRGGISVGDFQNLDVGEKTLLRFEAKLNGGGAAIELETTNGGVRIRPRNTVATDDSDNERDDRLKRLRDRNP